MELKDNQTAIILETCEDGEITVDVESPDFDGLAGKLSIVVARKIMEEPISRLS